MKKLILLLFLVKISLCTFGQVNNDSIDVLHYKISLNTLNFKKSELVGRTEVTYKLKKTNLGILSLDYLGFNIDSVFSYEKKSFIKAKFTTSGTKLLINTNNQTSLLDSYQVLIYYHGKGGIDPSTFGGVGYDLSGNGIVYNMGIGLSIQPPTMGKAWFPCVDDFMDKATFEIQLITPYTHYGFSNGSLINESKDSLGNKIYNWKLEEPIPTYLACFAVGKYSVIKDKFKKLNGDEIDRMLVCNSKDSATGYKAFDKLDTIFRHFESLFGPYRFKEKIGYVSSPQQGGAMEHATAITYPDYGFTFSGASNYTLMGHELAHHWFGDNYTCSSANDMWLNEGWASFAESIVMEKLYGKASYIEDNRDKHNTVLNYAHLQDVGYHALYPIPAKVTYGRHTYLKGANVIHTLRFILGDVDFFKVVREFQDSFEFGSVNSFIMRDFMGRRLNKKKQIDNFFQGFIFDSGFVNFEINKWKYNPSSKVLNFSISQNLKIRSQLYQGPILLNLYDENQKRFDIKLNINGANLDSSVNIPIGFKGNPLMIHLNEDLDINEAKSNVWRTLDVNYTDDLTFYQRLTIKADSTNSTTTKGDTAKLYLEYHFAKHPEVDSLKNIFSGFEVSKDRYWKIDGFNLDKVNLSATIKYDGRKNPNNINSNLDTTLKWPMGESNTLLFYKDLSNQKWSILKNGRDFKMSIGAPKDKLGQFTILNLKPGYYLMGTDLQVGIENQSKNSLKVKILPNPNKGKFQLQISDFDQKEKYTVYITDSKGSLIYQGIQTSAIEEFNLTQIMLSNQQYNIQIFNKKGRCNIPCLIIH